MKGQRERNEEWERLATNLRVEKELLNVLSGLQGLPVVVFKGAVLTRMIYGDLRRHASADNDLWVPEAQTQEALRRLLAKGYRPARHIDPQRALRRVGQVELSRDAPESPVLDLHSIPFSKRFFEVSHKSLTPHLVEVPVHGRMVTTFDRPLALVHLTAHWVQHHLDPKQLPRIRDAWDSWAPELDAGVLQRLAQRTCTLPALEAALALSKPRTLPFWESREPRHPRAKITVTGIRSGVVLSNAPLKKLFSVFLVAPGTMPRTFFDALVLEKDDLHSRYGSGSRASLLARHLWRSLKR